MLAALYERGIRTYPIRECSHSHSFNVEILDSIKQPMQLHNITYSYAAQKRNKIVLAENHAFHSKKNIWSLLLFSSNQCVLYFHLDMFLSIV